MKSFIRLIAFLLIPLSTLRAQDSSRSKWSFGGYVKDLRSIAISSGNGSDMVVGNQIHNRLNVRFEADSNWTFALELRNRLFYGESIKASPDPLAFIDYNDYFDLSTVWLKETYAIGHSVVDRAYIDYHRGKFEARIGRQRINWGISSFWNPNDLFNAFNFLDWDYEERQGSDAIRLQYYSGFASHLELAARMSRSIDSTVAAALWRFNHWNFDWQLLAGIARGDMALGAGWTGYIGSIGLNGEAAYFHPYRNFPDSSGSLSLTAGLSYLFPCNLYINYAFLYSSQGRNDFAGVSPLSFMDISAKNLSPFKYNMILQSMFPATPLININAGLLYSPGSNAFIFFPGITFSLSDNMDFDLLGQFLALKINGQNINQEIIYTRLKWSF